jgi:hypothetical protein
MSVSPLNCSLRGENPFVNLGVWIAIRGLEGSLQQITHVISDKLNCIWKQIQQHNPSWQIYDVAHCMNNTPEVLTFVCFLSRLSIESVPESNLPLSLPTHSNSSIQSSNCWFESLSWHHAFPDFTHEDLKMESCQSQWRQRVADQSCRHASSNGRYVELKCINSQREYLMEILIT